MFVTIYAYDRWTDRLTRYRAHFQKGEASVNLVVKRNKKKKEEESIEHPQ